MTYGSSARRPSARERANSDANPRPTASGKPDRPLDARQDRIGDRASPLGAARHQRVELRRVGQALPVARLDRRPAVDDQVAELALELGVPLPLEAALYRLGRLAREQAVDRQQVEEAGTARVEAYLALRVGRRACDLAPYRL